MAPPVSVKQRGEWQPCTALGANDGSCAGNLAAARANFYLLHDIGAKPKLLELEVLCFLRHLIPPLPCMQAMLRICCKYLPVLLPLLRRIYSNTALLRTERNRHTPEHPHCT